MMNEIKEGINKILEEQQVKNTWLLEQLAAKNKELTEAKLLLAEKSNSVVNLTQQLKSVKISEASEKDKEKSINQIKVTSTKEEELKT
jgi:hypothetical protein